jgi:hypothetical protein
MNTDERLDRLTDRVDALTHNVELLASMHKDHEVRFERFEQAMTGFAGDVRDAVGRLARIAEANEG